jgi:peptide/nickel transport system permease protein
MLNEMATGDITPAAQELARTAGGRGNRPKARQPSLRQRTGAARRFLWRNRSFTVGLILVIIALACTFFAPWVAPHNPYQQDVRHRLAPPFWIGGDKYLPGYVLGTDQLGRDLLSRMIYGIQTSLIIGVTAVALAISIGVTVGLFSGFFSPGITDTILMRITDIQLAFPFIVLAIAILTLVRPTPLIIICVLSLAAWPMYARVIRSIIIMEKEADYVTAARVQGASNLRLVVNYIARNVIPPVFIVGTIDIATMVVFESLLSFIQLGVQPPQISLGNIMADGKNYIATAPWITGLPGFAIMFTVLGFNLMGDSLQKYIDPKLRR